MGHGVVLSGEAGIGKSRLVQVLKEHVAGEAHTRWECRCSPYYQHTALYPIIDLLQRALRWQPEDTAEERLTTLEYMLRQYRLLFKHALIQDVAYQSLLKSTRQHYHQRIAQALEARFPEVVATQPELLAHHYVAGGYIEQTVTYWQRAGEQASDRAAHVEAVSHFTTGIELLTTLPETPAHTQQALTLYIALGAALQITKGQGAPEVEHAYTRAHALCQQVGETPEIVPTLLGLWRFYNQRAHFHTARDLGDTLLRLGQQADDRTRLLSSPIMPLG
jgi:predicted ATPase